jgi:chemotaxis protein methyltransferase CheR
MTDLEYELLKRAIRERLQIDLAAYKTPQMRRRLDAFVQRRVPAGVPLFCRALRRDDALAEALRTMLTINVSEFFRDPTQFQRLRDEVLPSLVAHATPLRIWSAACSHGAEPYSIAMLVDAMRPRVTAEITATDIDAAVLDRARAGGPYAESEMRHVSPAQRRAYFTACDGGWRINDDLRARVRFDAHDLTAGAVDGSFDLIVCRNVLIYFADAAKRRLFDNFYDALRPGGVLFLGGTEALLGADARGFERIGGTFHRKVPGRETQRPSAAA